MYLQSQFKLCKVDGNSYDMLETEREMKKDELRMGW